jgi:hypothetical protein
MEKAVWHNEEYKSRVIQLLYDLNDVSFDLISKNNFELDTTWPTIELQNNSKYNRNRAKNRLNYRNRTRGNSISSFISTNMIINSNAENNNEQVIKLKEYILFNEIIN